MQLFFILFLAQTILSQSTTQNPEKTSESEKEISFITIFLSKWQMPVALITAFGLAFAVGGNDVANPFGTSVGSGALTIKQVYVLAAVFETLGALLLGGVVAETIRKKILHVDVFRGNESLFVLGEICAMMGAAVWQIIATIFGLPISSTHSIVGSTIGFAVVQAGWGAVQWKQIGKIAISWVTSPLCAGALAAGLYVFIIKWKILVDSGTSLEKTLMWLPIFYALTVAFNVWSIGYKGSEVYFPDLHGADGDKTMLIAGVVGITAVLTVVTYCWIKYSKADRSWSEMAHLSVNTDNKDFEQLPEGKRIKILDRQETCKLIENGDGSERPDIHYLFGKLQAFAACFDAFAHGANDVGNSIGPVLACYAVISTSDVSADPKNFGLAKLGIIAYASFAIICGLLTLGKRVIKTIGEDLTPLTPARGFSVDIMSGVTVVLGSLMGIPLSTTHCKVGAVVSVGLTYDKDAVKFDTFKNILAAWLITVPASAAISAVLFLILKAIIPTDVLDITL